MSIDKRLISTGGPAGPAVCTADTLDIFGDSSCVALYGLNYDASDAGGNYNGTPSNVDFNALGYMDYAASFNGSSSHIDFTSPIPYTNTDMTFSCWINLASSFGSSFKTIVGAGNKSVGEGIIRLLIRYDSANSYKIEPVRAYSGNSYYTDSSNYTAQTINAGSWYNIIYSYSSSGNTAKIYLNGSLVSTTNLTTTSTDNTNSGVLSLGQYRDSSSASNWNGRIDQVRIFNKAISSSEVTTLYGEVACEYTCTTDTNGFPASASSDLVAYYKLDGDATDDTGSYNGTATDVTFNGGRYGSSAVFNGSSSFINTGISNTTIPLSSDFSISTWINTNSSSGFFIAEGNFNSWNTAGFGLGIISSNRVELSFGNVAPSGGPQVQSSALAADTWYHIVAVVDIGNVLTLYVNGVSVGTDTITSSNRTSVSGGFNIGADAGGYDYTGKLDQVRFYTKALSSTEVSSLYEDEHQCYITVDSTDPFGDSSNIALYEFENNANDSTGSYNGTASGVTYSTDSIIGTYSANFDGSGDYVTISATATTPLDFSTENFSISHWVYPHNTAESAIYSSKFSTGAQNQRSYYFGHTASGNIIINENPGGSFLSTGTLTQDAWSHVVYVRNATTAYVYINGSLDSTHSRTNTIDQAGTQNIYFGRVQGSPSGDMYDGLLDQTRFFNKALDGDEIWKLYAEGAKG